LISLASGLTKRLDAAWAVGTNQGGLDTGSIADGTYHVWLIRRSDTGVVDVLFSTSVSSPTMPSNYDQKRRIGAIMRASGTIRPFRQEGDWFVHDVPVREVDSTNPGTSAVSVGLSVPSGVKMLAEVSFFVQEGTVGGSTFSILTSPDQTDTAPASNFCTFHGNASGVVQANGPARVFTNTSCTIRYRLGRSDTDTTVRMYTLQWRDPRGKE
jgi:hypothetical protein